MQANSHRRILHIDDDEQFTRLMGERLRREGYQYACLHDPTEALDELARNEHHVVLLDIQMPQLNGLELLRQIKRQDGGLQAIMVTSFVGVGTILQSMRWGAEACFFKPLMNFQPLVDALEMAFRKRDRWWITLAEFAHHRREEALLDIAFESQ